MSDDEKFEQFIQRVLERPLPPIDNPIARMRTFAKELAEGATYNLWPIEINSLHFTTLNDPGIYDLTSHAWLGNFRFEESNPQLSNLLTRELKLPVEQLSNLLWYIIKRWDYRCPDLHLLKVNGYVNFAEGLGLYIEKPSFDLVEEIEPASIFISYRRKDSSAFSLLILKHLKENGLDAFLDMALVPGEDWHAGLKERIQGYDYLIAVLGKETLSSDVVIKEISWAIEAGLTIIPVWHNGFKFDSGKLNLPSEIDQLLSRTQAIEVKEESALGYETAIIALLNRFGVTP